ncbi:MAG: hypothetical protein ACI9VR_003727 [Cognaticolwellia sp.]|jgi:hypothetical protein
MLLLMLACLPNSLPVARSLALGAPDHVWGDSAQLHLAWDGGSQDRASIQWGQLGRLELRHLTEGDELVIHVDGRPLELMRRREGRLDREAALVGSWAPLQVRSLGASDHPVLPWSQAGDAGDPVGPAGSLEVERVQGWVKHCTAERIARVPNIAGVIELELHVAAGQVSYVAVLTDTVRNPMLNDCILRAALGESLAAGGVAQFSVCQDIRDCG